MKINKLLLTVAVQAALLSSIADAGDVEIHLPAAADAMTVDQPAGTELMRVNGDGNVGIGTSVFNSGVFGSGTHLGQQILHDDGTAVLLLESYRDAGNHSKVWAMAGRGTQAAPMALNNGDFIFELNASTYDGINFDNPARIALGVDDNGTVTPGTSMPGKITFRTSPDGDNQDIERMRIDSAGNVGIGTTTPDRKLHVVGNGGVLELQDDGADQVEANPFIRFTDSTGTRIGYIGDGSMIRDAMTLHADTGDVELRTNTVNVGFVLKQEGNVGIGSLTPAAKLDVQGNINVADEGNACDAATEGQIRYEATLKKHQGCDGTSWNNLY